MRAMRTFLLLASLLLVPRLAASAVAEPTVQGPISASTGGAFVAGTTFDLADVGYVQEEFFISGTASAYTSASPLASDGAWSVTPASTAAYKTRILVYRPARARAFSGTVFVEWLNVSGGLDSAPDWITAHIEMIRAGMVWVGVSAQFVGVEGGGGLVSLPLKSVNPRRYGTLVHPGDSYSYDMFSQAGQALRGPSSARILGGLVPDVVIAAGESQSASRMVTYVNGIHPLAGVFDGFLIHSRSGGGAPLSQNPLPPISVASPMRIRTDVDVPVFTFQTETDVPSSVASRQADTDRFRLWEVAGTAHADSYTLVTGMPDRGDDPSVAKVVVIASPIPGIIDCGAPINSGPQHFVLDAALHHLDRWIRRGTPPPTAPRLETLPGSTTFATDAFGNVLGGVRTPWVDVPVAKLSGFGQPSGGSFCGLFGTTVLFDGATLDDLYPSSRVYVRKYRKALTRAVRAGFMRRQDATLIRRGLRDGTLVP
jgi:hypothetical protein